MLLTACEHTRPNSPSQEWADYKKGYAFLSTRKDSAYWYFNQAANRSPSKQVVALAYYNMAMIQTDGGDYYGAQESLTQSLRSLNEHEQKDWDYLATDYNELGMTCTRLNNYRQALNYYRLALHYIRDSTFRPYILNNRGNAYKKLGQYPDAIASYGEAMRLNGKINTTYARILTNLATARWLYDPHNNPVPDLMKALAIRKQRHDIWGQNSSYAQLSDFYIKTRPDSARRYAQLMLKVADILQSPDDEIEALRKLILLSPASRTKAYFGRYGQLTDSLETRHNEAKNQFALIRYNVERNKADNLRLQKENAERNYELSGLLLLTVAGTLSALFWYRKRKQRIRQDAENLVQQNKLRLSQKVHDVIANGIYGVMNEVEYSDQFDRDDLLDKLEAMYELSRDISHEKDEPAGDTAVQINRLFQTFKSKTIRLAISGNEAELWEQVNDPIKGQLMLILRELVVNLNKHSRASQAAIMFELKEGILRISYRDNGVGIPETVQTGNGLRNTVSRITALNGRITFDTRTGKGAWLQIEVPLN
jgi:signal transduction histidine kinase